MERLPVRRQAYTSVGFIMSGRQVHTPVAFHPLGLKAYTMQRLSMSGLTMSTDSRLPGSSSHFQARRRYEFKDLPDSHDRPFPSTTTALFHRSFRTM